MDVTAAADAADRGQSFAASDHPPESCPFAGTWKEVSDAVLIPPDGPDTPQRCGAFVEGKPVELSRCYGGSVATPTNIFPDFVPAQQHLPGVWLFGGILSGHFGHMLCEATGRLWALDERDGIDGVLFFARPFDKARRCARQFGQLAALLDLPKQHVVTVPTSVDRLVLAGQGLGYGDLMIPHPATRDYLRKRLAPPAASAGTRRFYITRTGQPARRGRILGEAGLEALLTQAGYEVIRPEDYSLAEQVEMFGSASHVIATEGSPFHLLAMAAHEGCKMAVIKRREGPTFDQICAHLEAFLGPQILGLDQLFSIHAPRKTRNVNLTYLEPSRRALSARLSESGFLPPGTDWPEMSDEERAADLAFLESETGHELSAVLLPSQNA